MRKDERRNKRFSVENIEGSLLVDAAVDILNISLDGVALKANRRLEIGREYALKIDNGIEVLSIKGTVVWSVLSGLGEGRHNEKYPIYKAGLRFGSTPRDTSDRLQAFIEENRVTEDKRLTIRFNVLAPDSAILNVPLSYSIKTISMGGMCIESDLPFSVEDRLSLEAFLPGKAAITCLGRVAFCSEAASEITKRYEVGIEFLEMSEDDKAKLKEYIALL